MGEPEAQAVAQAVEVAVEEIVGEELGKPACVAVTEGLLGGSGEAWRNCCQGCWR